PPSTQLLDDSPKMTHRSVAWPTVRPLTPAGNAPMSVARPLLRSIEYKRVIEPTVSAAKPTPVAGAAEVVTRTVDGMSKPLASTKSSVLPFTVIVCPAVSVPLLGGFWMNSVLLDG